MRIITKLCAKECHPNITYCPKKIKRAWSQSKTARAPLFKLRVAIPEDRKSLENFLLSNYYHEEPLRAGAYPPIVETPDIKFHLDKIGLGMTILAVRPDYNDSIVGAVIGGPKVRWVLDSMAEEYEDSNCKWGKILNIWAKAEKESNIYDRLSLTRVLHAYALAVHKCYRGHGLGLRLLRELAIAGKYHKLEAMSIDATSLHGACLCQRYGMRFANIIPYTDYRDSKGYRVFTPEAPHDALRTYYIRIH